MPQKKTARKSNAKKRTVRTSPSPRRSSKKNKVYIPAYKVIIFCCVIITICMGLLLITNLKESDKDISASIAERFEEEKTESSVKTPEKKEKTVNVEKVTPKAAEKPVVKTAKETAEKPAEKKVEKSAQAQEVIKTPEVSKTAETQKSTDTKETPVVVKSEKKYNFPAAKNNAQLVFVFDDGGQNLNHLAPFLKLPFPITVAVLPQLAHSKEAAAQVRKAGFEVMLHQPMQAVNASVNPGPGAIKPEMSEGEIKSILFQNITEIGPIAGMNNHEGSAITADAEKMAVVLQFCSQEGIYFLDSRTNVETQVPYVAGELGYSYYERNIFLDNEKTNENALKELKKGLDLANKNGSVIMIGHIWSADFLPAFLQDVYPELKEKGYTFSVVSKSRARKN